MCPLKILEKADCISEYWAMSENKEYNLHRTQVAPETKTQIKQILQGKKWAISLSGGGVRSVAHLGVLQAFEETGLKPTALSGCSSGALVAALYAAGQKPNDILNKVKTIKWWKLIKLSNPFNGILLTDSFV